MKDDLLYDPLELDLGAILKEDAEQLIETLELPEMLITEDVENEHLYDTLETDVPAEPLHAKSQERLLENRQLLSPSLTSSTDPSSTPSSGLSSSPDPSTNEPLPAAPRNWADRENEITADFD